MQSTRAILITVVAIFAVSTLGAGVVPGRWEKVAAEKLGSSLIATMKSGERIDGFFKGLTDENLNLTTLDGQERAVRKSDVARIITADKRMGSLTNGFLIGAAAGATITGIVAASIDDGNAGAVVLATVIYGLIGGAIGVGIDAAVQGHITLYEAPKTK